MVIRRRLLRRRRRHAEEAAAADGGAQEEGRDRPPANGEQTRHKYATPIQCDTSNHLQCYWDFFLFFFPLEGFFLFGAPPENRPKKNSFDEIE